MKITTKRSPKMVIRCKVYCSSVEKLLHSDRSKGFVHKARFGPAGQIEIATYKEDVFTPGKEYYLDFTEATNEEA